MERNRNHLIHNILLVFAFLLVLLIIGVIGYMILMDWEWYDALYMTFISFSTVGFAEIGELDERGRFFTMFIISIGLVLIGMLSATVTSWFVSNELLARRKKLKMKKQIERFKNHTILCGAGDTGVLLQMELDFPR